MGRSMASQRLIIQRARNRELPVLRGGSWFYYARNARCANRGNDFTDDAGTEIGFRCVRGFKWKRRSESKRLWKF